MPEEGCGVKGVKFEAAMAYCWVKASKSAISVLLWVSRTRLEISKAMLLVLIMLADLVRRGTCSVDEAVDLVPPADDPLSRSTRLNTLTSCMLHVHVCALTRACVCQLRACRAELSAHLSKVEIEIEKSILIKLFKRALPGQNYCMICNC